MDKLVKKVDHKDKLYTQKDASELEDLLSTIAKLEQQIETAKNAKPEKGGGTSKIDKADIKSLEKEVKDEKKKAARLEVELIEQKASREKLQLELESIKSKLASLDSNNSETDTSKIRPHEQAAIDQADMKLEAKTRELKATNEKIVILERNIRTLQTEYETKVAEKDVLKREVDEGTAALDKLKAELKVEEQKSKGAEIWKRNLSEAFKERDAAALSLKDAKAEEIRLKKELEGKGTEMGEAIRSAEARVNSSISKIEKEIELKVAEINKMKTNLANILNDNSKAQAELNEKISETEALKASAQVSPNGEIKSKDVLKLEAHVDKLKKELDFVQMNIAKLETTNAELVNKGEEIIAHTARIEAENRQSAPVVENNAELQSSLYVSKSTLSALETELSAIESSNEQLRASIVAKERALAVQSLSTPPASPETRNLSKEDERDLEEAREEARRNKEIVRSLEARLKELEESEREDERSERSVNSFPSRPPSTLGGNSRMSNNNSQKVNANEKFVVERLVKSIKVLSEDTAKLRSENISLLLQIADIDMRGM